MDSISLGRLTSSIDLATGHAMTDVWKQSFISFSADQQNQYAYRHNLCQKLLLNSFQNLLASKVQ